MKDALLLVDMQDFYLQNMESNKIYPLIAAQTDVLERCKGYGMPLILLEMPDDGDTTQELSDITKGFSRRTIIKNPHRNGFQDTFLDYTLKNMETERIYLMGIHTKGAIAHTAAGAVQNGYEVWTAKQLIAGPGKKDPIDIDAKIFDDYKDMLEQMRNGL